MMSRDRALARRRDTFAWSLETTRPQPEELTALRGVLRPGSPIYLSAVPQHPRAELIATARAVATAGFEPVPHLAVRGFASARELDDFLRDLTGAARVRRLLLIGGDVEQAGPFGAALDVIESGALARHGIAEVGLAGYPDGHPRIDAAALDEALRRKLAAAQAGGLAAHIVTQFCFDPSVILAWLTRLRQSGVAVPVQVGIVGPTSLPTLLRYARRCGVRASARTLMTAGIAKALIGGSSPDAILAALLQAGPEIGDIAPHFFSFGGVLRTAAYAAAAAAQQFPIDDRDPARTAVPN